MKDEVKLHKVGDSKAEDDKLPWGVRALILNNELYFVRRVGGRFMPLPKKEQEELKKKHTL